MNKKSDKKQSNETKLIAQTPLTKPIKINETIPLKKLESVKKIEIKNVSQITLTKKETPSVKNISA